MNVSNILMMGLTSRSRRSKIVDDIVNDIVNDIVVVNGGVDENTPQATSKLQ